MKKILFVIVAVFTVLVFKPTTAANATSTTNEAVESSILNTTQEEMEIISGNRMLLPPSMNAVSIVPPMSATSKTSSQNIYKNAQIRHLDVVNAQIHLQKKIQQHHYKIISQAVNYYIFFLRRIRI
ncbi:MAG: hypothetical protein IKY43_02715 [Bacteroidales bacterium]|nr:hypothetical protein [Bacteroidales bacterium]